MSNIVAGDEEAREPDISRAVLKTIIVFAFLGPLAGAVAVLGSFYAYELVLYHRFRLPSVQLLGMVGLTAYIVGFLPALLTGFIVAFWQILRGRSIVSALVAPLVAVLVVFALKSDFRSNGLGFLMPVSLVASLACWAMTCRAWRLA
jgi:hypothetical protein